MNKTILSAGLALLVSACVIEPAHAWLNWKVGAGVNWSRQSGGNNLLWGAFRNGQPPAPNAGHQPQHPGFMPPGPGMGYPTPGYFPQFYAPGFGGAPMQGPSQAGAVPFHPVSFPGQYIPETDYSEPTER